MLKSRRNGRRSRTQRDVQVVEYSEKNLAGFLRNPMRIVFKIQAQEGQFIHIDDVRHNIYTWVELKGIPGYEVGWVMGIEIVDGGKAVLVTVQVEGETD